MGGDIEVSSVYGEGSVFTASIPQTSLGGPPLAVVENPKEKSVLCFDDRPIHAKSIAGTLEKLEVPVKFCETEKELFQELERLAEGNGAAGAEKYAFVFVPAGIAKKASVFLDANFPGVSLVVLANPGDTSLSWPALFMPVYAVTVASILNHQTTVERRAQKGRFICPEAKILVVDDVPTNLTVAQGLLALFKPQVDTCTSGQEAIEQVKNTQYDIVFMDHMMPGMDGIETTAAIRDLNGEYYQKLPIVALTANAITGMKESFLKQGFDDFLSKPIEIAKLNEIMNTWIPESKKKTQQEGLERKKTSILPSSLSVDGIDFDEGRERYGEEAWLEVLRSYTVHTPALLEKLQGPDEAGFTVENLAAYTITVHGLKGSNYGICAGGAGKQAEALEHAARDGDIAFVQANNNRLIETVKTLLENIKAMFAEISGPAEAKPRVPVPDPALLEELLDACKRYKTGPMENALKKLESYEYESGGELVAWLREQLDNLEYDAIQKRLEQQSG
jgi:CheY-like chemotaxis protein